MIKLLVCGTYGTAEYSRGFILNVEVNKFEANDIMDSTKLAVYRKYNLDSLVGPIRISSVTINPF